MKNAISSIHIEAGKISVVKHNDRSLATVNSIFNDEVNEFDISGIQAIKKYHNHLKPRIEAYSKRTGQKLNKKTITHLSAVVNIKSSTTLEELRQLASYLEKEFGTKVFQIAIHRDEGHIKDEKNIKNYHAHVEMLGIDNNGNSIRKKLTRSLLSKLQDKTAEILQMERGINYAKEKKKRPRRLGTYEYKEAKRREEKIVETVKKELTEELSEVTTKLKIVTQNKLSIENVLKEIMSQLNLKIERGKPYTYIQIKSFILDKFNELHVDIKQIKEDNNTYNSYLYNAKKMYLALKQKNSELEVALQDTREQLKSSFIEVSEHKNKIEFLEDQIKNNKDSNSYKDEQEDKDDEDNVYRFGM